MAETVKKRIGVYFSETTPLIDYYSQDGKLLEIEGEGSVVEVESRIIESLGREVVKPSER
jgi:adenylate kinase